MEVGTANWVTLNVGGKCFTTTKTTLLKYPDSIFHRMFSSDSHSETTTSASWASRMDANGAFLFDRSPAYFEPILDFLRHGKLITKHNLNLQGVLEEAEFFGIPQLAELVELELEKRRPEGPLTRRELSRILAQTPHHSAHQLRFQGLDLEGADLSCLDLRNINFKFANLSRANLSQATLSHSNLEWANLTGAVLDGAQLLAVKLTRAQLENAKMKNCNFEDPHQQKANLEGANLKGADLSGSQMAGVNLRVASLKNAQLRNCDLRCAVLAGADLENCDLSGSDLQEANLRGANFVNATFQDMLTPLHMSQTLA